jgi:CRP-like cAMP-binding protein
MVEQAPVVKENVVAPLKRLPKLSIVICTLGEGSIVGEDDVLNHSPVRSYTCRTLVACKFYTISVDVMLVDYCRISASVERVTLRLSR